MTRHFPLLATRRRDEDRADQRYPVPAEPKAPYLVETNEADGNVIPVLATGIRIFNRGDNPPLQTAFLDNEIELLITDARVTVAIKEWIKPGVKYSGLGLGAVSAGIKNSIQEAKAAAQMDGKLVLGQFRHAWTSGIWAQAGDRKRPPAVLLTFTQRDGSRSDAGLLFDKRTDSYKLADEIAVRVARHHLGNLTLTDEQRDQLQRLVANPHSMRQRTPEGMDGYLLPGHAYLPDMDS